MRNFFRHPYVPLAAGLVLVFVAIHEWQYKSDHPYAYGPALYIALAAAAGAVLAFSVAALAWENLEREEEISRARAETWRLGEIVEVMRRAMTPTAEEENEFEEYLDAAARPPDAGSLNE